jgi:hypothetical protein
LHIVYVIQALLLYSEPCTMSIDPAQLAQYAESVAPWTVKAWIGQRIRTAKGLADLRSERVVTKRLLRAFHRRHILGQVDTLSALPSTRGHQITHEDSLALESCVRVRACETGRAVALFSLAGQEGYRAPLAWYVRFSRSHAITIIGQRPALGTKHNMSKKCPSAILKALEIGLYAEEIRADPEGNLHWSCLKYKDPSSNGNHERAVTYAAVSVWAGLDCEEGAMAHKPDALARVEKWLRGDSVSDQLAAMKL